MRYNFFDLAMQVERIHPGRKGTDAGWKKSNWLLSDWSARTAKPFR